MSRRGTFVKSRLWRSNSRLAQNGFCIIAVAGRRKSGKTVFVEYIKKNYPGFHHIRIADAPMYIARLLGLPRDRTIYQALFGINSLLFPILGESVFKRRAARILDFKKPRRAIVEAIRTKEEYREFVTKRGGILVGIKAAPKIRFQRALLGAGRTTEKQDESKLSFQEFIGDPKKDTGEYSPIERETGWIMKHADFVLENDYRTKEQFYREIEQFMRVLGIKKKRR